MASSSCRADTFSYQSVVKVIQSAAVMKCAACDSPIPEGRNSCPSCGTAFGDSVTPTRMLPHSTPAEKRKGNGARPQSPPTADRPALSYDSIDDARFAPGTTIAGRYRIVSLLGRGGMGEVYRADDLKLGQAVALKFLPEALHDDGAALARFHREVRIARQVSHRNVCRVYDIGEVNGQHFLSMEFIKGEELASLLRRIGRLPTDKAVEIARQLCAGLAAAHDNNVLHRDLKPANVMIDSDGNVRITDFGLAGLAEEFRDEELRAGTPAYMAPEQLEGREVTIKSDIYALGLVLYEIFTGKRAFSARTIEELIDLRRSATTPTNPSDLVKEIDPLVERVILRCLEKEPRDRPASALQVAAALPGGDPLQAALAAGETPSPEMVAAAPTEGALRPIVALALLASIIAGLALAIFVSQKVMLFRMVPLEKSPEVLSERAREIARKLGYTDAPVDSWYEFEPVHSYLRYVRDHDASSTRWDKLASGQPAALEFIYRQSPRYFVPVSGFVNRFGTDTEIASGMIEETLDTSGRLTSFNAIPPQIDAAPPSAQPPPTPDWAQLFTEAGLNQASFHSIESQWTPPHAYDARAAWEGTYPEQPQFKLRVEAAAYRGKVVYFQLVAPWDKPLRQEAWSYSTGERVLLILLLTIFFVVLLGSLWLAMRHLRLGRGDRKGAFRLALFVFLVLMLQWVTSAHHVPTGEEIRSLVDSIQSSLFWAGFIWLLYVALEPFVRRRWPEKIISWSRLLSGDFRDPLIGRDILVGALFGIATIIYLILMQLLPSLLGYAPTVPFIDTGTQLIGMRSFGLDLTRQITAALYFSFIILFVLLLLAIFLRRDWLVGIGGWLIIAFALAVNADMPWFWAWPTALVGAALYVAVLYRYGLLAMVFAEFFFHLVIFYPLTTEFGAWYAGNFVLALIVLLALAAYGFYISLAGQKVFSGRLLED